MITVKPPNNHTRGGGGGGVIFWPLLRACCSSEIWNNYLLIKEHSIPHNCFGSIWEAFLFEGLTSGENLNDHTDAPLRILYQVLHMSSKKKKKN